jgi:hypothetical protein
MAGEWRRPWRILAIGRVSRQRRLDADPENVAIPIRSAGPIVQARVADAPGFDERRLGYGDSVALDGEI